MSSGLAVYRFAGVALAGGKTDKTAVAVIDYYKDQSRIFLRSLRDRIRSEGEVSADLALHRMLTEEELSLHSIAFDVPLQLPKCIRCELKCPGFEKCRQPEIKWMWNNYHSMVRKKKPHKLFTPYTERCSELHIASELEEPFHPSHALGANAAPLAARAHFIRRRLPKKLPTHECYPKLSVWRIGRALKISKAHLRLHRNSVGGEEARQAILNALIEEGIAFIYQQDLRQMIECNQPFEAFISALTLFLHFRGQCQKPPPSFPKGERWIIFPKESIQWF